MKGRTINKTKLTKQLKKNDIIKGRNESKPKTQLNSLRISDNTKSLLEFNLTEPNSFKKLVRYDTVRDKILSYDNVVIDNVDEIVDKIKNANIKDERLMKEHINRIRKEKIGDSNKCPKCGGELVKRNGKYGNFIGCINYPRCKYTRR